MRFSRILVRASSTATTRANTAREHSSEYWEGSVLSSHGVHRAVPERTGTKRASMISSKSISGTRTALTLSENSSQRCITHVWVYNHSRIHSALRMAPSEFVKLHALNRLGCGPKKGVSSNDRSRKRLGFKSPRSISMRK